MNEEPVTEVRIVSKEKHDKINAWRVTVVYRKNGELMYRRLLMSDEFVNAPEHEFMRVLGLMLS